MQCCGNGGKIGRLCRSNCFRQIVMHEQCSLSHRGVPMMCSGSATKLSRFMRASAAPWRGLRCIGLSGCVKGQFRHIAIFRYW